MWGFPLAALLALTGAADTVPIRCAVGERPGYFVPGDDRLALLGCARLGVSGKRVELSGSVSRIDGERHMCINPAYSGRGRRGFFIPAKCMLRPPPPRFAVHDASQPRQGVRGYEQVIWGIAPARTTRVVARFEGGTARAAVFDVDAALARRLGERPFAVFVVELPVSAACGAVTLSSGCGSARSARTPCRVSAGCRGGR